MATQLNSNEFYKVVNRLIKEYDIQDIIETGTFMGDGSTRIFAETGKTVITVECNPIHWEAAKNNLKQFPNVVCLWGFSLNKNDMIRAIMETDFSDFPAEVRRDHPYSKAFYMREIGFNPPFEAVLSSLLDNKNNQLVFLDSAGGIGFEEYNNAMYYFESINENAKGHKVIMLDDVNHVKHYRSVQDLKAKGYLVNFSSDGRFAWAIIR